jgi:hypothetical protein
MGLAVIQAVKTEKANWLSSPLLRRLIFLVALFALELISLSSWLYKDALPSGYRSYYRPCFSGCCTGITGWRARWLDSVTREQ